MPISWLRSLIMALCIVDNDFGPRTAAKQSPKVLVLQKQFFQGWESRTTGLSKRSGTCLIILTFAQFRHNYDRISSQLCNSGPWTWWEEAGCKKGSNWSKRPWVRIGGKKQYISSVSSIVDEYEKMMDIHFSPFLKKNNCDNINSIHIPSCMLSTSARRPWYWYSPRCCAIIIVGVTI